MPRLTKSTTASISADSSAAAGVSIMIPARAIPAARHAATKSRASSTVATIGAMTSTSAPSCAAASAIAVS
ncbi:hypothetical protein RL72_00760 [Microbacterium azadirachtae]|uniref:Uncharacterized protein n=1 Tax=Microbacterium azadirachtae TaxID=582680 RepID=A0A0F0L659_9MICO|nr:hypothetical protein RL72_00760 [Microbacterium azadirachtae]